MRTAIILAGGKARRFQIFGKPWMDKALAEVDGKTFIEKVTEACLSVVDEVIISTDTETRGEGYKRLLENRGVRVFKICIDEKENSIRGVLLGVGTGLIKSKGTKCVTIPVDHPFIKPEVIDLIYRSGERWEIVIPIWPNGRIEPLIALYDKAYGVKAFKALNAMGGTLGVNSLIRGSMKALFIDVGKFRKVDPELKSFININCPEDLELKRIIEAEGEIRQPIGLERKWLGFETICKALEEIKELNKEKATKLISEIEIEFWKAMLLRLLADKTGEKNYYLDSGKWFKREAELYCRKGIRSLELHALIDAKKSLSAINASTNALEERIRRLKLYV